MRKAFFVRVLPNEAYFVVGIPTPCSECGKETGGLFWPHKQDDEDFAYCDDCHTKHMDTFVRHFKETA